FDLAKLGQSSGKRRLIIPHFFQFRLHAKCSIQFFDTLLIFPSLYKNAPELGTRIGRIGIYLQRTVESLYRFFVLFQSAVAVADVGVGEGPVRIQAKDTLGVGQGRTEVTLSGLPSREPKPPLGL